MSVSLYYYMVYASRKENFETHILDYYLCIAVIIHLLQYLECINAIYGRCTCEKKLWTFFFAAVYGSYIVATPGAEPYIGYHMPEIDDVDNDVVDVLIVMPIFYILQYFLNWLSKL